MRLDKCFKTGVLAYSKKANFNLYIINEIA